jgi:hypothetical protein
VPLFFGSLAGLIYALYQLSQLGRPLTLAERLCVAGPLGVFGDWCTVGTIANTSASLFALGYTDPLISEQSWAVIMLIAAGIISAFMTSVTRGNAAYALTIVRALIGIVVANASGARNLVVAVTAASVAALVTLVVLRARLVRRRPARGRR